MVIGIYNGDMKTTVLWGTAACSAVDTAIELLPPQQRPYLFNKLHGVMSQKNVLLKVMKGQ
jgi:hypothetical protein